MKSFLHIIIISMLIFLIHSDIIWTYQPTGVVINGIGLNNYILVYQINFSGSTLWLSAYFNGTFISTNVTFPTVNQPFRLKSFQNSSVLAYQMTSTNQLVSIYLINSSTVYNITTASYIECVSFGSTQDSLFIVLQNSIINKYQFNGTNFVINSLSNFSTILLNPTSIVSSSLHVFVGCQNGSIVILDINTLSYLSMVTKHSVQVSQIILNSNETILFSGDTNGNVYQWSVGVSQLSYLSNFTFHTSKIQSMLYISNTNQLIIKDTSGVISQLDLDNWQILGSVTSPGSYNYLSYRKTGSIFTFQYNFKFTQWDLTTVQNSSFICNITGCNTCQSTTSCLLCEYGYTTINHTCFGICYDSDCITCSQFGVFNVCTSCKQAYSLNSNGTCFGVCYDYDCVTCSQFGVFNVCTSCKQGYSLNSNGTCLGVCYDTFCVSCSQFGMLNTCISCLQGYFLNSDGTCSLYYLTQQSLSYLSQSGIVLVSQAIFKTPMIRRVVTASTMAFLDLDELWIYQYHHRNYGPILSVIFQCIRLIEDEKWQILGSASNDMDNGLQNIMQNNTAYSSYKFVQLQGKQSGFLTNTLHYFLQSIPLIFVSFMICRFVFHLIRNYKFSMHFRNYSFYCYFLALIMAGNLHYFVFLSINQCQMLFSFTFFNKIYLIGWTIAFFFIILYSLCGFYLFKYLYQKLSKYFLQNQYRLMPSFLYSTCQAFFRNFFLGFTHSYLLDYYNYQVACLIFIDIICFLMLLYFWKGYDCFKLNGITSLKCLNYFLFILLDFMLLLQYNYQNYLEVWQMLEQSLLVLIIVIAANSGCFTLYSLTEWLSCLWQIEEQEQLQEQNEDQNSIHQGKKQIIENIFAQPKGRNSKQTNSSHNSRKKKDVNRSQVFEHNRASIQIVPKKSMLLVRNLDQKGIDQGQLDEIVLQCVTKTKKQPHEKHGQKIHPKRAKQKKQRMARESKPQTLKNIVLSKKQIPFGTKTHFPQLKPMIQSFYKQAFNSNKNSAFCIQENNLNVSNDIEDAHNNLHP